MTFRAVMIGTACALVLVTAGYINDHYICMDFSVGNHLPITIFGMLILAMVGLNPLMWLIKPSWRFRPAEIAVILALVLAPCGIVSSGFLRTFTPALLLPIQHNQTSPGWRKLDLIGYVPPSMLPGGGKFSEELVSSFMAGANNGWQGTSLDKVPWAAWQGPLMTWLPLVVLMLFSVVCLSLVLHPQWANRERLRYPIAEFASILIRQEPGRATAPIFRERIFWIGLATVLSIRILNGLNVWYSDRLFEIPLSFDLSAIGAKYKTIGQFGWPATTPQIFPAVVGFTFFLASEISFSVGILAMFNTAVMCYLFKADVDVSGKFFTGGLISWLSFGAYVGFVPMLIYIARNYYGGLIKGLFLPAKRLGVEGYAVWAFRGLMVGIAGMIVILSHLGLDWPLAIVVILSVILLFVVQARINTESGIFFYQAPWLPLGTMVGMFGLTTLGPKALLIIGLASVVLTMDTRECLIPFVMNSLKISDRVGVRPPAVGSASLVVVLLCLSVGVPVALWANYSYGLQESRDPWKWISEQVPKFTFDIAAKSATELRLSGDLEKVNNFTPMQRLAAIAPEKQFLWALAIGAAATLFLNTMRLRFPRWPLHPIFALCFGCDKVYMFSASFLLGWFIKTTLLGLGGTKAFERGRTFMVGVIAGDLLGGLVFMIAGWIYYLSTGVIGPQYRIFPWMNVALQRAENL